MIGGFANIFKIPELKRRILFTLALLIVYRVGVQVPTPGVDSTALASIFAAAKGTLLGLVDMFSGGALEMVVRANVSFGPLDTPPIRGTRA